MKIVFLNTWNGRMRGDFESFVKEQANDTDVFCFQEMYDDDLRERCCELLPDHQEFTAKKYVADLNRFMLATYVRSNLAVASDVLLQGVDSAGAALGTQLRVDGKDVYVCNIHGTSRPGDKLDTPTRLWQSQALLQSLGHFAMPQIVGGDYNLLPDTDSIHLFEEQGYRSLIKEYGIPTTRNRLAWERYLDNKQYYSDYAFVTPDVQVQRFQVPQNEIADHLPLILEVDV